ncbi:MAG: GDP-mannose 4,6-dehydratase, partial [Patescibacteria group bacterium]|nr:GDP-mannose 4,6-dehydratase [Patescibacteria group bacterium]
MKLLVTGGAGFIGANFIHYWLKNHPDDDLINYDMLTYAGNLTSLDLVKDNPHYSFIKGDIGDAKAIDAVMAGVDIVVHFAAESHVDRSITGPQVFVMTNVVGTQVLLDAALKHKVKRFHHISTDEVFGSLELGTQEKFSETTAFAPNSPYSASKAGSD